MAITEAFSNTVTISTTEISLSTGTAGVSANTDDGVYQVFVDTNALAAGDQFVVKFYEKVIAAGTQRLVEQWVIEPTNSKMWASPSFILMHGWDFTLTKLAGTDRSMVWSIRKVA